MRTRTITPEQRAKYNARARKRYADNPDLYRYKNQSPEEKARRDLYNKEWRKKHPEKAKNYQRAWAKKNPAKCAAYMANWRAKNPEKYKVAIKKQSRRIAQLPKKQWAIKAPDGTTYYAIASTASRAREIAINFGYISRSERAVVSEYSPQKSG